MRRLQALYQDERGFIVSMELVLIATVALIGLLAGYTAVRDSVVSELSDVAGALQDMNQSYSFYGVRGHSGSTAGADYIDRTDYCDVAEDVLDGIDNCIEIFGQNQIEENDAVPAPSLTP